jgi:hypothetical protein
MSTNSPVDRNHPSQLPQLATGESQNLRILLLLLFAICLVSLGSLSLVPNWLPASSTEAHKPPVAATAVPPGGECTMIDITYLPKPEGQSLPPASWRDTGRSKEEFALLQGCAASFVITYQSFDATHLKTLEASVPMLSAGAQKRFYAPEIHGTPNRRMKDDLWRAGIQRTRLQQQAQAARPRLIQASQMQGRLAAWLVVPYQISIKRNNQSNVQAGDYTVLLVERIPKGDGTGWQVSDWREGSKPFVPPDPL